MRITKSLLVYDSFAAILMDKSIKYLIKESLLRKGLGENNGILTIWLSDGRNNSRNSTVIEDPLTEVWRKNVARNKFDGVIVMRVEMQWENIESFLRTLYCSNRTYEWAISAM